LKPELTVAVEVCMPSDEPALANFENIVRCFGAMYQSLWEEDARYRHRYPVDNLPFFALYSYPNPNPNPTVEDESGFLTANLRRHQGLNGFTTRIERCPVDVAGNEGIEVLFEGHYALDGAAWPPAANNGNGNAFDGDGDPPRDVSPDRDSTQGDDED
jgi:hypothetical protein